MTSPVDFPQLVRSWAEDQSQEFKGYFDSSENAASCRDFYRTLNDGTGKTCVPPATDLPRTNEEKRKLAQRLFEAIRDTGDPILDTKRAIPAKNPRGRALTGEWHFIDNSCVARVKRLSSFELELMAWELLDTIINAQQGFVGICPWAKEWKYERYATFSERFNSVLREIRVSKSLVMGMCDVPWVNRIAAAPFEEVSKKVTNGISNGEKNDALILARQVKTGEPVKKANRETPTPALMSELERIRARRHIGKRKAAPAFGEREAKRAR